MFAALLPLLSSVLPYLIGGGALLAALLYAYHRIRTTAQDEMLADLKAADQKEQERREGVVQEVEQQGQARADQIQQEEQNDAQKLQTIDAESQGDDGTPALSSDSVQRINSAGQ